jgi:hypothetical protein
MVRNILFTVYGLAVGVAYTALFYFAAPRERGVVTYVGPIVLLYFGLVGRASADETGSVIRRLGLIILIPGIPIYGMIGVGAFLLFLAISLPVSAAQGIANERRFRNRMRTSGRFLTLDSLRHRLAAGEGTLIKQTGIVDPCRLWWTEDDLLSKGAPVTTDEEFYAIMRGEAHAFNSQCCKEYLDTDTGKAFLTSIPIRYGRSGRLARLFPRMPIAEVVNPRCAG